jgi:hypothetical protein
VERPEEVGEAVCFDSHGVFAVRNDVPWYGGKRYERAYSVWRMYGLFLARCWEHRGFCCTDIKTFSLLNQILHGCLKNASLKGAKFLNNNFPFTHEDKND